jgi:hypothetical protein
MLATWQSSHGYSSDSIARSHFCGPQRSFAADLASTGHMRQCLSVEKTADIIWSMNSPEFYLLLVEERGWSSKEFGDWLADAWVRLLLEH